MADSASRLDGGTWAYRARFRMVLVSLLWAALIALALRFILRDVLHYTSLNEASFGRFWPQRWYLIPHVAGGVVALLLGPLQFWTGLRRRALRLHRWTGRLYLGGIVIGASSAFYLSFFIPPDAGGWPTGVSTFILAAAWLITGAMALVAIRNGRVTAHKEWMIRSYVLTFSFVNFRLLITAETPAEDIGTIVWLCWTVPLFITEVLLNLRHVRRQVGRA